MEARNAAERCDGVPGSRRVGDGVDAGNGQTGRSCAQFPPAGTALSVQIAPPGRLELARSLASSRHGHAGGHSRTEGTGE